MFSPQDSITALEIGTASIKVLMGKPKEDGSIAIIGYDEITTLNRVIKGDVINVPAVAELLGQVLNNVEAVSREKIRKLYVAVTGSHIKSINVIGSVPITSPDRIITNNDIVEATRNAREYNLPLAQKDIHTYQRTYIIDDTLRVSNPEGMAGNKLTADIHVIYGNYNKIQTICSIIHNVLGAPADDIAFTGIADFYGLPVNNDHAKGTLVIDIGAGVTEYVVFYNDGCMHSGQITVGCEHIANDLSIGLRIPIDHCRELLKQLKQQGLSLIDDPDSERDIEVQMSLQPARVFKESIPKQIITLRLNELFKLIKDELSTSFIDEDLDMTKLLGAGIILCGGGALIPDIKVLAKSIFNFPVEIGYPLNVSGVGKEINSPKYITPVGLLYLGHRLDLLEKESTPTFRQTVNVELNKLKNLTLKAFRF